MLKWSCGHRATLIGSWAAAVLLLAATDELIAATFVVTTTADGNNGACTVALCSLRDAIIAANANPGADVITLPAGTYTLTIPGANEDAAATGDLDITGDLTINGAGVTTTIVEGGGLDRVFDIRSGTVAINDLTIRNGSAVPKDVFVLPNDIEGGGVRNDGILTLNRCAVSGNSSIAFPFSLNRGGGISNNSVLTINDSTISANSIQDGGVGAGIYNAGTLTINNSTVSGNMGEAFNGISNGGGVYNDGTLTLTASTISGNQVGFNGNGGGIFSNGALTVKASTINNNGGEAILTFGPLVITNSTISGNSGGVFVADGGVILDTTIANNFGFGIAGFPSVTLTNTIVANTIESNCIGTIVDGGTNLQFPGITCGTGISSADPLLQPLADNGGPTQTHALSAGSPAINAGTTGCPPTPPIDQRGVARPKGSACDIGAFELVSGTAPAQPIPTLSASRLGALASLVLALAIWAVRRRQR